VDGAGNAYECVLDSTDRGVAVARIVGRRSGAGELETPLVLLAGLPDSGPAESVVGFAVPLGVTAIDFAACVRSGRPPLSAARLDRLDRIARSALKQSRRSRLPEIRSSGSLAAAIALLPPGPRYVADPAGDRLASGPTNSREVAVAIAVGPPGGFDSRESALLGSARFLPISLGPSRLATETAAVSLLSIVRNSLV
jgi:16S rRNA (uracil1498-N3)-methyltransferase